MKAVTHHTMPLRQFLYTDSCEALPGEYSTFDAAKLKKEDCAPVYFDIFDLIILIIFSEIVAMMDRQQFLVGHSRRHWNASIGSLLGPAQLAVNC